MRKRFAFVASRPLPWLPRPDPMAAARLAGAGGVSLESTEILSPTSPSKPAPPMAAMVMLPPPAVAAPSRSRASSREKDAAQGMKYEGVIDWLHYAPGPRVEQSRFTSVSVGDMYWRIVSPIRTQELVRVTARDPQLGARMVLRLRGAV